MTDEQARRLEEIRQEVRLAAHEIAEHQDSFACCERLVDAVSAIIRFLEADNK
jgi:hypothetical protein